MRLNAQPQDLTPVRTPKLTSDDVDRIVDALERRLADVARADLAGAPAMVADNIREHARALEAPIAKFDEVDR